MIERGSHAIPFISSQHRLEIREIGDRRNQRRFAWGKNPNFRNAARHSRPKTQNLALCASPQVSGTGFRVFGLGILHPLRRCRCRGQDVENQERGCRSAGRYGILCTEAAGHLSAYHRPCPRVCSRRHVSCSHPRGRFGALFSRLHPCFGPSSTSDRGSPPLLLSSFLPSRWSYLETSSWPLTANPLPSFSSSLPSFLPASSLMPCVCVFLAR